MFFCRLQIFFNITFFFKIFFHEKHQRTNSLDPDQARPCVGPDLGLNCLQRSSADNKLHHEQVKS